MSAEHPLVEILRLLPELDQEATVFDVGANVGQSLREFLEVAPRAKIFSFEPVRETFARLQRDAGQLPNVTLENLALGSNSGTARMKVKGTSTGNSIIKITDKVRGDTESVRMVCGDDYCTEMKIDRIDYLKIDTEGHDLNVLTGFRKMIAAKCVGFIQIEAGLNAINKKHVDLQRFRGFLEPLDYHLFDIRELTRETDIVASRPFILRRADCTFIEYSLAAKMAQSNKPEGDGTWSAIAAKAKASIFSFR